MVWLGAAASTAYTLARPSVESGGAADALLVSPIAKAKVRAQTAAAPMKRLDVCIVPPQGLRIRARRHARIQVNENALERSTDTNGKVTTTLHPSGSRTQAGERSP